MKLWYYLQTYIIEVIGLAIFLMAAYRIIMTLFFDELSKIFAYAMAIIIGLFLMSYKNIQHNFRKITRR